MTAGSIRKTPAWRPVLEVDTGITPGVPMG